MTCPQLDKDGDGAIDFVEFVGGLKHLSWIAGQPGEQPKTTQIYVTYIAIAAAVGAVAFGLWKFRK